MNKNNTMNTINTADKTIKDYAKPKNKFGKIISKAGNFFSALLIMFIVLIAIWAFMEADLQTKNIAGDYNSQIFSYAIVADNRAEVKAFGESFTIDLDKISYIQNRLIEISDINKDYTPSFIILSGNIINECISSVGGSLKKIPDIIKYFYNRTRSANTQNQQN